MTYKTISSIIGIAAPILAVLWFLYALGSKDWTLFWIAWGIWIAELGVSVSIKLIKRHQKKRSSY